MQWQKNFAHCRTYALRSPAHPHFSIVASRHAPGEEVIATARQKPAVIECDVASRQKAGAHLDAEAQHNIESAGGGAAT